MRSIPRDHDSMDPARKKALGMSGLKGWDECFSVSRSTVQLGGKWPEFQTRSLSS